MPVKITTILFIAFLGIQFTFSQKNINCPITELNGYIIDGQQHTLTLKGTNQGKAYFSLFDGFQYRIVICSSTQKNYKIALFDIEKKMLLSTHCDDYTKVIDVAFLSGIAGYIEIIIPGKTNTDPEFEILIGFKEDKALKKKNNSK